MKLAENRFAVFSFTVIEKVTIGISFDSKSILLIIFLGALWFWPSGQVCVPSVSIYCLPSIVPFSFCRCTWRRPWHALGRSQICLNNNFHAAKKRSRAFTLRRSWGLLGNYTHSSMCTRHGHVGFLLVLTFMTNLSVWPPLDALTTRHPIAEQAKLWTTICSLKGHMPMCQECTRFGQFWQYLLSIVQKKAKSTVPVVWFASWSHRWQKCLQSVSRQTFTSPFFFCQVDVIRF